MLSKYTGAHIKNALIKGSRILPEKKIYLNYFNTFYTADKLTDKMKALDSLETASKK